MLTLCYSPGTCALSDLIVLALVGKPYQLCRVSREERTGELYKRVNPRGQVPALVTEYGVLTENAAILLKIADAAPEAGLVPALGTPERDRLHEWLSYLDSGFHVAFYPIFKPSIFSDDPSHAALLAETAKKRVAEHYRHIDAKLAGRAYVLGDRYTVLDPYLVAMGRWGRSFLDLADVAPNVDALLTRLQARPEVVFGLAVERGEIESDARFGLAGHVPLRDLAA